MTKSSSISQPSLLPPLIPNRLQITMTNSGLYLLTILVATILLAIAIGIVLLIKRSRLNWRRKTYRTPLPAIRRDVPVIRCCDSTPFAIPPLQSTGDIVNIEIQPSVFDLPPHETAPKSSTPTDVTPQIKFSVHYDKDA